MKKYILLTIAVFLIFLASCKNPFVNDDGSGIGTIKINLAEETVSNSNARKISPSTDISLSRVDNWKVSFISGESEVKTFSSLEGSLLVPVGTYKIAVTGTATVEEKTISYYGEISDVNITAGVTSVVTIYMGLKKSGTGSLSLKINIPESSNITSFSGKLVNYKTNAENVFSNKADKSDINNDSHYININYADLDSGYYKLEVNCLNNDSNISLVFTDNLIEITDGYKTSGEMNASFVRISRDFYATTNDESPYNGLSKDYPATTGKVLEILNNSPFYESINLYYDNDPIFKKGSNLVTDFLTASKKINIYVNNVLNTVISDNTFDVYTLGENIGTALEKGPGTVDSPLNVIVTDTNPTLTDVSTAIKAATDNYIYLDISGCTGVGSSLPGALFKEAANLVGIDLPEQIEVINYSVFAKTGLKKIVIPEGCVKILESVFAECTALEEVHLPETITRLGTDAFFGCTNLKEFYFDGTVDQWCGINFNYCTGNTNYPLMYADNIYFNKETTPTTELYITASTIKRCAFADCGAITKVTIASSVISLNKEVDDVGGDGGEGGGDVVFTRCTNLKTVVFEPRDTDFTSLGNYLTTGGSKGQFGDCGGGEVTIYVPEGKTEVYTTLLGTPSNVTFTIIEYDSINVDSAEELKKISANTNAEIPVSYEGITININKDITITSGWTPISSANGTTFKGTINGNGHKISVPMTEFKNVECGFAGLVGINNGTIMNVEYYIDGYSDGGTFTNTSNMLTLVGTSGENGASGTNVWSGHVGGIAARNNGIIKNCWNRVNFSTPFLKAGGIAGYNNGIIENCLNTGNIAVYNAAGNEPRVGGIAGAMKEADSGSEEHFYIKNCVNYGTVGLKNGYSQSTVKAVAGSICGGEYYNHEKSIHSIKHILDCYFLENSVYIGGSTTSTILDIYSYNTSEDEEGYVALPDTIIITGCGYFESGSQTIIPGEAKSESADNCWTAQTLEHGEVLLTALNAYVTAQASDLKSWKTVDDKVVLDFTN